MSKIKKYDTIREFIISLISIAGLYLAIYGQYSSVKNNIHSELRIDKIDTQNHIEDYYKYIRDNNKELNLKTAKRVIQKESYMKFSQKHLNSKVTKANEEIKRLDLVMSCTMGFILIIYIIYIFLLFKTARDRAKMEYQNKDFEDVIKYITLLKDENILLKKQNQELKDKFLDFPLK